MSTSAANLMTTEELLSLPNDGRQRWLIRGELRAKPLTVRNRWHSRIVSRISQLLGALLGTEFMMARHPPEQGRKRPN